MVSNRNAIFLFVLSIQDIAKAFLLAPAHLQQKQRRVLSSIGRDEKIRTFSTTTSDTRPTENNNIAHRENYDSRAWEGGFQNVEQEVCLELDGDFPKDLEGTFFQNGHAKFRVSDDEFHIHPFDADGMVQAVTFENGKAWFRNRYIQTPGYQQELKEKKVCKRGVFGTARNKGKWYSNIFDIDFKNVANTHVLFMGNNELYALWEAGSPFQMDPTTLETIGESTMYGAVDGKVNTRYAAHYKIDPRNNNVCGFAIVPGDKNPANSHKLCVMEHHDNKLLYKKTFPFGGFGVAHDCSLTEHYFIFLQSPLEFKPLPFLLGLKGASECMEFDDTAKTASIVLLPRGDNKKEPIAIEVPPYFAFHFSNSFEDENGEVVVDIVAAKSNSKSLAAPANEDSPKGYPTKPFWEGLDWKNDPPVAPNRILRVRLDPIQAKLVSQTDLSEDLATVEFPVVNPQKLSRPYKYAYCATSATARDVAPLQGLAKIDVETGRLLEKWLPEPDQFLNEVAFCPKANSDKEDDGYLVTYILDPKKKTNEVVVFDASNPGKGPIARSTLDGWCVNHSLHGVFVHGFAPRLTDEVRASFDRI
eukprot:scaffold2659_cov107-Cylindrotheca_fusiformis.AAC.6